MKPIILALLTPLSLWLWAADDAAVLPSQGVTAAPSTLTSTSPLSSFAITIPRMLSYQGKLTDSLGNPVPDGNYQLTFRLYTEETGGSPFWTEAQTITVRNGLFSALLGAVNPIGSVPDAGNLYLSLQVGIAPELTPRLRIVSAAYAFLTERAANSDLLQGKDTTALDSRYVNESQANSITSAMIVDGTIATADIANNAITSAKIGNGEVTMPKINQSGATLNQVIKWNGTQWAPANDSVGQGDSAWVRGTPDSVLYTIRPLGIARGGSNNMLYGNYRFTHTNLGVACVTGTSGEDYPYCTVGGGNGNTASARNATVAGGAGNTASGPSATVAGGRYNTASGDHATVAGGYWSTASGNYATVGGGPGNRASHDYATVAGGYYNVASGVGATVGGGYQNRASGNYATVAGGYADTSDGYYSFTTNNHSVVPSSYSNSAAFNGEVATASNQTRVGVLSKASGSFTIDHPLDPYHKILNHYFIEGPEMRNLYDGEVILDASGRATVHLPDYFSALNRKPRIQLTGVGTSDVYVAEDIQGNVFVIGGKPGTKVYWQVTGERQDVSAEATRRMMPVEQPKTGELAGRMLDDDFLAGCMLQLEREGKAEGLDFRTPAGRARYEQMKNPPKPEMER